jgi:DNA-binding response OmpR family regulator
VQIILIVEDDTELRGIYRTALRVAGYGVQEAGDGYEALRAVDADPPDLVVLDLALPRLSGRWFGTNSPRRATHGTSPSLSSPERRTLMMISTSTVSSGSPSPPTIW